MLLPGLSMAINLNFNPLFIPIGIEHLTIYPVPIPILFIAMSYNNEMAIFKHSYIWKLLIVYCVGVNSKFISKLGCIWMVPLSVDSIATSILFTTISDDDKLIVFKNSYPWASLVINSVWIHSKLIHACFEISPVNFSINFSIRISSYNEPVIWEHSYSW